MVLQIVCGSMSVRDNSLVRYTGYDSIDGLTNGDICLYLSEIVNMKQHCIVVRMSDNSTHTGYHTFDFVELTDEEI